VTAVDAPPQVRTVVVTGAGGGLGSRVVRRLQSVPGIEVHQIGRPEAVIGEGVLPDHVDVVVHLAAGDHDALAKRRRSAVDGTAELLAVAGERGATAIVLLSSALVYGAWPNNPVPLTEDAVLRPDNAFAFARQLAVVEQLVDDWRLQGAGRVAAVLRPVPSMAADGTTSLARALAAGVGRRLGEDDVPAQFLHLDDLADAAVLATVAGLDGVYNVSPDGWVPGPRVRALAGHPPRLRLPERVASVVDDLRWRFQRGPIPPGLRPYTQSPWMVANDRLRTAGWSPTVTNEQAFVEGTEARWWTMLTPKRKQEIALGAMGVAGLLAAVGVVVGIRRARRHLPRR
jgi:nucleoside-diphosphate-sugar epimerase